MPDLVIVLRGRPGVEAALKVLEINGYPIYAAFKVTRGGLEVLKDPRCPFSEPTLSEKLEALRAEPTVADPALINRLHQRVEEKRGFPAARHGCKVRLLTARGGGDGG